MSPLDIDTVMAWRGRTIIDRDGEKIGTLGEILLDSETDSPAWGGVRTGLFGRKESYLPLDALQEADDDALRASFEKQQVVDAPSVDPEVAMTSEDEATLFRHYGREDEPAQQPAAPDEAEPAPEGEMIRSEEEIRTGTTEMRPTERVRLKKVLVTDEVTRTVPVRREEVRMETEAPPEGQIESVEEVPEDERS